ncbi:MAG TPA: YihY/virulence factor BrkB family protein [Tangfeifania sp.]|nr:YihY/virulence factor BrkB family protein [Tangfeifania sp.]
MKPGLLNRDKYKEWWEKMVERAEKVSLPFFDGVPLYDVALFFGRSIINGSITTRASAIAFSFFIAFFPAVLFLFTLIPYIPIENFQPELFRLLKEVLPTSTFETIEETVTDIIMRPRGGLLSLGFVMALIFSTNGIASMMSAFDATVHSINRRSWVSQRIAATYLLVILSVLLFIAIALLTGGEIAVNYLKENDILRDSFTIFLLNFGRWIVIILLLFFATSFLYYMAPAKKSKWRFISAGSTLSTFLSIIALYGFTYYINNFSQYNKLYGSIGTLLIILFLMYLMSLILLIGFELNASIYQAHTIKRNE